MSSYSRREKWTSGPSNKRKAIEETLDVLKPSPLTTKKLAKPSPHHRHPPPHSPKPIPKPLSNNHLLAGYLAHEFLSKGTLFGQPWDPARAEAVPVSASRIKPKKAEPEPDKSVRYKEVADLMKTDGAHLPGIVNPTQLGRFLQLG